MADRYTSQQTEDAFNTLKMQGRLGGIPTALHSAITREIEANARRSRGDAPRVVSTRDPIVLPSPPPTVVDPTWDATKQLATDTLTTEGRVRAAADAARTEQQGQDFISRHLPEGKDGPGVLDNFSDWLERFSSDTVKELKAQQEKDNKPKPTDPTLAYDSPSEGGGRFGGTGLGTPEVTVIEPEKKEEKPDTSTPEKDIYDYYATIDALFPAYDTSNPKQDAADAYAERANERTALLAQLALGGAMVAGSGKSWEGMGKGFIGMAGMYDQGYERYQKAMQTSADRYASTQKDAQGYDLAKRQAALELYTSGQTNARETAKDERDFLLKVATEDRQVQEMRRAEAKEIFAPNLERFKRIEGDPFEPEDREALDAERSALAEAIDHYIKTGQVTRPRAIVKPTTK